ncbi:helix-turn-helix transcriptional regulator [Bacillus sp. ISL-41]|uniref:helix-turn-helix domain-containing protein n=1 Tax=Bacillus sp. ISL-41 TaxID=2819127 RepID=UPI001BE7326D|nr:helix-turn-helix transcriptional regulator [Bacillus sp. ISL-41]MBT2643463.1 helix-turn-helix transcriptional regulator [Bacillus sp. ISL-41]
MLRNPCKEYGFIIQIIREGLGMSIEELAFRTETSPKFIQDTESSKVYPSDKYIELLSNALDIPFNELKERIWCEKPDECSN